MTYWEEYQAKLPPGVNWELKFKQILHATENWEHEAIELFLAYPVDIRQVFFSVRGKGNLSLVFETLIQTAKEKENVVHTDSRGHMENYTPSKSTQKTRSWRILRLFLHNGLSHEINYVGCLRHIKQKWQSQQPWDLVLEELLCLLISNCVEYSTSLDSLCFGRDVIGVIQGFLGWDFPSISYLKMDWGWLFPPPKDWIKTLPTK